MIARTYQGQRLCYLPKPKAKADNMKRGLDNLSIYLFASKKGKLQSEIECTKIIWRYIWITNEKRYVSVGVNNVNKLSKNEWIK